METFEEVEGDDCISLALALKTALIRNTRDATCTRLDITFSQMNGVPMGCIHLLATRIQSLKQLQLSVLSGKILNNHWDMWVPHLLIGFDVNVIHAGTTPPININQHGCQLQLQLKLQELRLQLKNIGMDTIHFVGLLKGVFRYLPCLEILEVDVRDNLISDAGFISKDIWPARHTLRRVFLRCSANPELTMAATSAWTNHLHRSARTLGCYTVSIENTGFERSHIGTTLCSDTGRRNLKKQMLDSVMSYEDNILARKLIVETTGTPCL